MQLTRTRHPDGSPRRGLLRGHDEGAVTMIVAVVLAGGVLLGMAALTVDVGLIHAERRELQNGADAGALAVAQQCAVGPGATRARAVWRTPTPTATRSTPRAA